jgi:hypothetical protein
MSEVSKEIYVLKGVHPFNLTSFRVDRFVYVLIAVVICYRNLNTKVVNIETNSTARNRNVLLEHSTKSRERSVTATTVDNSYQDIYEAYTKQSTRKEVRLNGRTPFNT